MKLHELIRPERIVDLKANTKKEALEELCELLDGDPNVSDLEAFRREILKREELLSTGMTFGLAVPHARIPQVRDFVICVGRKKEGLEFDALDGQPARLIFMIGAAETQMREYVKLLASITRMMKDGENRVRLLEAEIPGEFLDAIRQYEQKAG